jgi:queuine tRNA-ribosyltransferase
VNLRNAKHADDPTPLDADSKCTPTNTYSRAYLHHLVRSNEILGMMLLTWNNLAYYQELMAGLRKAIAEGRLDDHIAEVKEGWARGEKRRHHEPASTPTTPLRFAGVE